jgi:asparagine synthase (glutamine-hydrolysing)
MPGLYGYVGPTPQAEDLVSLAARMGGSLRHHDWYQEDRHVDPAAGLVLGRVSLGFVNRGPQPAAGDGGTLLAVLDGEIYEAARHRADLAAAGVHFRSESHAELLVRGYERRGQEFLRSVHGCFTAALWDADARRLILTNDRFGMKPLYWARPAGRLLFASEVKALLAHPEVSRRPSLRGIAQFFTFGQLLGDDTLLDGVTHLPAAAWVTYEAGGDTLRVERYWRLGEAKVPPVGNREEALDRLDAAFKRAVDRTTLDTPNLGLSLSGGLDARTILAVMDTARTPVTTVCLGMEGSIDRLASEQMAQLTGSRYRGYCLDASFLGDYEKHLRCLVHLTDGHFQSQCLTPPTLPLYRELGIEVLLRGHAGELLHMDKAYSFSLDDEALALRDGAALEAWLLARLPAFLSAEGSGPLFARGQNTVMRELAAESLRDCLKESAAVEPVLHRIWHLFITQRLRRETALSLAEFGSVVETRLPYLDPELVDLLLAVPPEWKLGDVIQSHILRKRRPEFLAVVNANTGARLGAGRMERLAANAKFKVLAKLGVRGYQPYERLGLWLRRELRPLVERLLLRGACLDLGVFNPDTIRAVVANHNAGRQNHTFLLLALMIYEVGQRELFDAAPKAGQAAGVA